LSMVQIETAIEIGIGIESHGMMTVFDFDPDNYSGRYLVK
jgi:hypothetical protein